MEMPAQVRDLVESHLGTLGFLEPPNTAFASPIGGILRTERAGWVFIKAAPRGSWLSQDYLVERTVLPAIHGLVRAPTLVAFLEADEWTVMCLSVVRGTSPVQPWAGLDVQRITQVYLDAARQLDPAPLGCEGLRSVADLLDPTPKFRVWRDLAAGADRALGRDALDAWCLRNLGQLAELEDQWVVATQGNALLHFDPRSDNQLIDDHGDVWLIDWSRACLGAPWVDLVTWAPNVQASGQDMLAVVERAESEHDAETWHVDAYLAALAGYWLDVSVVPDPQAPRQFQRQSATGALQLLQQRLK